MNEKKISLEHEPGALDPSYLLTYFVEPMQIGRTFSDWPLHITIIPWFSVKNIEQADEALEQIAGNHQPLKAIGSTRETFGEHDVCLVEPADVLRTIHKAVYASLQSLDARFISTEFFGDNYNPHVTTQGEAIFAVGEHILLNGFYLVRRHREQETDQYVKTIAKNYSFSR